MAQEYVIHYARLLDDIVAVDVINHVIRAILDWFRGLFSTVSWQPVARGGRPGGLKIE